MLSVSVAEEKEEEEEIRGIGADVLVGHCKAWNYYQTIDTPENKEFVAKYKEKYGNELVMTDPIEAAYFVVYLWAATVEKVGSFEVDKVREVSDVIEIQATDGRVKIDGSSQHIWETVRIEEVQLDGLIKELWNSGEPVKPDPYL